MPEAFVELLGFNELGVTLRNPEGMLGQPLKDAIKDLSVIAQRSARAGAPSHIKIARRTQTLTATVKAIGADAATWEIGRKPGAKMPPTYANSPLTSWAMAHGVRMSLFVIARAIARRGLRGRFYMQRAIAAVEDAMPGRMERMAREVEARFSR